MQFYLDPGLSEFRNFVGRAAKELGATLGFTTSDSEVISWDDNENPPTNEALNAKIAELKAEYDAQEYARKRKSEYPLIVDVAVALAEKAEGDSTMWDEITAKRAAVKTKWPKDNSGPV